MRREMVTIEQLAWDVPKDMRITIRQLDGMIWEPVWKGYAEDLRNADEEFLRKRPSNWIMEGDKDIYIYVK